MADGTTESLRVDSNENVLGKRLRAEYEKHRRSYHNMIPQLTKHDPDVATAYRAAEQYLSKLLCAKSKEELATIEASYLAAFPGVKWVGKECKIELTGSAATPGTIKILSDTIKNNNLDMAILARNEYGLISYDPEDGAVYDSIVEAEETRNERLSDTVRTDGRYGADFGVPEQDHSQCEHREGKCTHLYANVGNM